MEGLGSRKKPNFLSPIYRFASAINPESSEKMKMQQNINEKHYKERTNVVQEYVANWVYEAGVPFNAINSDSFKTMVEAIGQFGWHFNPPSQCWVDKKDKLRAMFTSNDWETCKWSKSVKGKTACSTVMSLSFWKGVNLCLRVFAPLVKVLRLVDRDRKPSMGFVYGELKQAKEEIKDVLKIIRIDEQAQTANGQGEKIDVLVASDASNAQEWIVEDGDEEEEPDELTMRELHEDDFESDDDVIEEVKFESDDDCVMEGYGIEDEDIENLDI
ncbi:hypothetical protein Ddye_006245 [Dipteronia dyeriana]|uniref:Uncharacterized protein n=1 Tax=Dipteronia dyeriana TaxID=168575 RepID=A0AAE0CQG9_9ROSI|nr:hypothetical protein Ddye_006245 [Dipteronia dyeriana]